MKYVILCSLLLLSMAPLSCSQEECEWRDVAKFANHEVQYFDGLAFTVVSGNSTQTEPFSVHEKRSQMFCASGFSDVGTSSDNMAPFQPAGSLTIDLYHYPDMRFVKTAVNITLISDEFEGPRKDSCFANVQKGMYCLYVSSSHVHWAVTVSECV